MLSDDIDERIVEELLRGARSVFISEDPEDPFVLIDRGSEGLVFIAPNPEGVFKVMRLELSLVASLETILQDSMLGYVRRDAILTVGCGSTDSFYVHPWDVRRRGGRLHYGYSLSHYLLLVARIYWCLENWGQASLILRSFTNRRDKRTGLPIKQIRGFLLVRHGKEFKLEKVPLDDLIWANTTDPNTGERLPPEPSVEYCYEDTCMSSDEVKM